SPFLTSTSARSCSAIKATSSLSLLMSIMRSPTMFNQSEDATDSTDGTDEKPVLDRAADSAFIRLIRRICGFFFLRCTQSVDHSRSLGSEQKFRAPFSVITY